MGEFSFRQQFGERLSKREKGEQASGRRRKPGPLAGLKCGSFRNTIPCTG
jgi:hypothetical protein